MRSSKVFVIAALLVSATVLAQQSNQNKIVCELASGNCLKRAELIQKKIKTLNLEIKNGESRYSPEYFKSLELKLSETEEILDHLDQGK